MILTPLQKLPNDVGDLGKIIVVTGFEWLSKVQKLSNLVTLVPLKLKCDQRLLIRNSLIQIVKISNL